MNGAIRVTVAYLGIIFYEHHRSRLSLLAGKISFIGSKIARIFRPPS